MMWRLKDIPAVSSLPSTIDAEVYNQVHRIALRSAEPVRIPLVSTAHIHLLIDVDSWVCVDSTNHDFPVVAWLEFDIHNRDSLQQPISCIKNYYRLGAGKVAANALVDALAYFNEHLAPAPVCNLPNTQPTNKVWKTGTAAELRCI